MSTGGVRGWLTARWQRHEKLLRFLVVGGINTVFGLSLYPAMLYFSATLHRHYMIALGVAQVVSLCFAFMMYKLAVFRTRSNVAREASTFLSFYAVTYAINWLALPLLVERAQVSPSLAQVGFTVVTVLASYIWHNRVTFGAARGR